MMAFAPGRLSTTPCWPHSSPIFCAKTRACRSTPEPAACGTMMRMGRLGKSSKVCAAAGAAIESSARLVSTASCLRVVMRLLPADFLRGHGRRQLGSPYEGLNRRTRADSDEMNAQQAGLPGRDRSQAHQLCLKPALRLFDTSPVPVSLTEPVTLKGPPNSFCSAL